MTLAAIVLVILNILGAGFFGGHTWYWIAATVSVVAFHAYFRPLRKRREEAAEQIQTTPTPPAEPNESEPHPQPETAPEGAEIVGETLMHRTSAALGAPAAILALLANDATMALIIIMYATGRMTLHTQGGDISYVTAALAFLPVLILFNIASAKWRPAGWFFRWLVDFTPSMMLWLTTIVILALALLTHVRPPQPLDFLALLGGLFVWGIADIFINQGANMNDLVAKIQGQPVALGGDPRSAPGGSVESRVVHDVYRQIRLHDEYVIVGPDGIETPMDDPGLWLTQHIDYHWVDDQPRLAAPPMRTVSPAAPAPAAASAASAPPAPPPADAS